MSVSKELRMGNEIEINTTDGKCIKGIFVNMEKGYLSAVANLGIIHTIPLSSVTRIVKA